MKKDNTRDKTNNLKNDLMNDLFIGMVNKPFLICLFGFCLKDLKIKLQAPALARNTYDSIGMDT